ncbi:MAG: YraN family protein [Aestuariivirgaceae bacterium]
MRKAPAMPRADRRRAERRGRTAELVAALFMMMKGYRPLAWRLKTSLGEIDLIMKSGRRIVFVEVKTRAEIDKGLASITPFNAQRMLDAARLWIGRNARDLGADYRFDILVVSAYHWPRHIQNAFGAELW